MLSDINYEKSCRICVDNNGFINIFHGRSKNENFLPPIDLINKLIGSLKFQIHLNDGLPETICLKCYGLLHSFDDFLNTIETSNDILRNHYFNNEDNCDLMIEKLENYENISVKDEPNNLSENLIKQNSVSSYNIETDADNGFTISNNFETDDLKNYVLSDAEYSNSSCEFKNNSDQTKLNKLSCEICAIFFESESKLNQHFINGVCHKKDLNINCGDNLAKKNIVINLNRNEAIEEKLSSEDEVDIDIMVKFDELVYDGNENLSEIQIYQCSLCAENFEQLTDLELHLAKHHLGCDFKTESNQNVRYVCEICKECFKSNYRLWTHRKSKHEIKDSVSNFIEKYKCPFCPRAFQLLETLKQHSSMHSKLPLEESKHICLECNITFKRSDHLKMHRNGFHLKNYSFHCLYESCTKSFITNWARNKHYKKAHSNNVNTFKCDACPKVYKSSSALRRHEKTHRELSGIQCNICKNYFARSDILREHLRTHNIDEKRKQQLIVETYDSIAKSQNKNNFLQKI